MVELLLYVIRFVVVLAIVLVILALFGISPIEAGRAVGDAFGSVGDFFEGVREGT